MATIAPTPSGTYKALVRMKGWPTTSKTFRLKRDAVDWARRTEDEMVRGVYISRSGSERMTAQEALQRYLVEVTPTKKPTTQRSENITAGHLAAFLGKYSMAALSSELVASYRNHRLAVGLGINDLHFHDLRDEAVSRLVEAGLSDQEVASISGHRSMQMLRRYTHLRAEDLVSKLDKLEKRRLSAAMETTSI